MSTPREEPLEANEADVAEQAREVAGGGSAGEGDDQAKETNDEANEANEADVQEQRTIAATGDDEDYPRS